MSDTVRAAHRTLVCVAVVSACVAALLVTASAYAGRASQPTGTALVVDWKAKVAIRRAPGSRTLAVADWKTSFGSVRRLQVVARRGNWFAVESDVLGNGVVGWVPRTAAVHRQWLHFSVEADLSRREVTLRRDGRVILRRRVSIGATESPTPSGRFHVTDQIPGTRWRLGCCIVVLSGTQTRLPAGWRGGDRLAFHGRPSTSEAIGAPASAGCLHATEDTLHILSRLPLGTPVVIHP